MVVLAAVLAACAPMPAAAPTSPASGTAGPPTVLDPLDTTVTRIVDGDTLWVADLDERVRLIGIDTPETHDPEVGVECYGQEATTHLASLVPPGTDVRIAFDVEPLDRYGRPLVYLYRAVDGLDVNLRMVADGYARVLTVPPNVAHADAFVAAEREARRAGRGLWSSCR